MRIMFVDCTELKRGSHNIPYLRCLVEVCRKDAFLVTSKRCEDIKCEQVILGYHQSFKGYIKWQYSLSQIEQERCPDIIHFLVGDVFYRYFGLGLSKFKTKIVMTFHHMEMRCIKKISYKMLFSRIDIGIVHTPYLESKCKEKCIYNIVQIDYPKFIECEKAFTKEDSRAYFGIDDSSENTKVLLLLGSTRYGKGLDLMLEAMKDVVSDYILLVAGIQSDIKDDIIFSYRDKYGENIVRYNAILTEEEMNMAISASDIVVLPYRHRFEGASGPLVEGVWAEKMIVGPSHGSLGEIIRSNHLGYTFETESVDSLKQTIIKCITNEWKVDSYFKKFRNKISESIFRDRYKQVYECLLKA